MVLIQARLMRTAGCRQLLFSRSFVSNSRKYAPSTSNSYSSLPGGLHPETVKANSHFNQTPKPHKTIAVNPPESTLPPALILPEEVKGESKIKYYFNIGRSYAKFYRTALKAVWINYRQSQVVASRIISKGTDGNPISFELAARSGLLTRADYQFIRRSRSDFKKLPLLGLLVAICGEFSPLVVVFVAGIVPRAAWIPKQVLRARTKVEQRREESFRNGTLEGDHSLKMIGKSKGIEALSAAQILHVSRALGLHSTFWEKLWDRPPQWLARSRVAKALEYLRADDTALVRDGGIEQLSDDEVQLACEDRGIDVLKGDVEAQRGHLERYMHWSVEKNVNIASLTLVRPSHYDQLATAMTKIEEGGR